MIPSFVEKQPLLMLVIFDMAGTAIEDKGRVPSAFMQALQANGFPVTAFRDRLQKTYQTEGVRLFH